jgi:hypothetical protein
MILRATMAAIAVVLFLAGLGLLQLMERFRPPPSVLCHHWSKSAAIVWALLHRVLERTDQMGYCGLDGCNVPIRKRVRPLVQA